jgi:hypothetical protein
MEGRVARSCVDFSVVPDGYVEGLGRDYPHPKRSHLYEGTYWDLGKAMCRNGYNRPGGYSIWRGNRGELGLCKTCLRRALKGLDGVDWPATEVRYVEETC